MTDFIFMSSIINSRLKIFSHLAHDFIPKYKWKWGAKPYVSNCKVPDFSLPHVRSFATDLCPYFHFKNKINFVYNYNALNYFLIFLVFKPALKNIRQSSHLSSNLRFLNTLLLGNTIRECLFLQVWVIKSHIHHKTIKQFWNN